MSTQGFVDFRGGRTWYRITGDLDRPQTPLLCLHGGPGGTSDLFAPLDELATTGRSVVVYDQLGSGRSERRTDPSLWTIETYLDELATVRAQLGLDHVHLLGHSWGGMLALEYLLTKPAGVRSLILASTLASTQMWCDEAERLRSAMPAYLVAAMRRCEGSLRPHEPNRDKATKNLDDAAIGKRAAMMAKVMPLAMSDAAGRVASLMSYVPPLRKFAYEILGGQFGKRHGSRADPLPTELLKIFAGMNREIYQHMWGPSEFRATGTLLGWDVSSRLHEIDVPTLITAGRYDESTPAVNDVLEKGIAGAERVTFENSAHCAPVEEPQAFRDAVASFIGRYDGSP